MCTGWLVGIALIVEVVQTIGLNSVHVHFFSIVLVGIIRGTPEIPDIDQSCHQRVFIIRLNLVGNVIIALAFRPLRLRPSLSSALECREYRMLVP